jgi:hypothetical protein
MKKFLLALCAMIMALGLTACGSSSDKNVSVDITKLASDLQAAVTSDTLSQTATEMVPSIYGFSADDAAGSIAYASSGATACEIAVVESKDSSKTGDIEKLFQSRVDSQSSLYASYNEGEVAKLDKAIIKSVGSYTVLCVCDDTDKAEEVLKSYGF